MCCSSHAGTFCSALLERGVLDLTLKLPLGNTTVPSLGLSGPGVTPQTADLGGKSGVLQRLKCAPCPSLCLEERVGDEGGIEEGPDTAQPLGG